MKSKSETSVKVKIFGVEYSVTGYENQEYLQEVAGLVDRHMRFLNQMQPEISPLRNAVLTAMNLADELLQTRKKLQRYQEEAANFNQQIADRSRKLTELCSQV